jgi:uncharacterized OB-fold protein
MTTAIDLDRPLPVITPETMHFWDGTRDGELRLQRCSDCEHVYFPPRPFCPRCAGSNIAIVVASGRATLLSYVISHLPASGFTPPYVIAIVALEEGPQMLTNIVGCEPSPEALELDMPLFAQFARATDDITLVLFAPTPPA